ncbi:hypothetical protein [Vannielia litorea]|uniref:hypothetical protein n=1 Tax=Vannielia litorea TaxID=1217970 RepID=UPI001BCACFB2|nr:hypothetical protein [Vannielia litorea]MBS8228849.1 hypothetical protein [Vannielia litorea]
MTEISALERRLTAAMDRIGAAVAAYEARPAAPSEEDQAALRGLEAQVLQLKQALEAEQTANGQLRERIDAMKVLKTRQQERIAELEEAEAALKAKQAEDREELDAVIAALEPLVGESADG